MKKYWKFYIITTSGRKLTILNKVCVRPNMTNAWKLLNKKLHDKDFIESVGYEPQPGYKIENGQRFKLGKVLLNEFINDFYFFPSKEESEIVYKYQLNNQL